MPSTTKSRRTRSNYAWLLLLIASCATDLTSSSSLPISSTHKSLRERPFCTESIANFMQQRCGSSIGSDGIAVWAYEGCLTDPITGKVVAEVEGLELVKPLPVIAYSSDNTTQSLLGNLAVRNLLFPRGNQVSFERNWDSAMTILSRRLFCYRHPASGKDNGKLLTSVRLRPDGPLRQLSSLENVAVYDSAVTYISRNEGREMVVFSERGSGIVDGGLNHHVDAIKSHVVMGSTQSNPSENHHMPLGFDFTIHARKESDPSLPPMDLSNENEAVISPRRSRLIQFGKSSESESGRKYDSVRETYSYSFDNPNEDKNRRGTDEHGVLNWVQNKLTSKSKARHSTTKDSSQETFPRCTVRYTRYGEAPPWYAPGRMCTLELKGERIVLSQSMPYSVETDVANEVSSDNISKYLPPLVRSAARKCRPSFWSGWPEEMSCDRAVRSFCTDCQDSVIYDALDEQQTHRLTRAHDALAKLQRAAERMKKSVIHVVEQ
ncbi:hypothetical protein HJC23_003288 [Cyclotella cryptica]|uniref:Uncharacterized protein n=1 Tax=Cyclotella cryptica TaxID=29204 RepID=A0ABD3QXG3_9STRA|eukprot:CCRYP_000826-RA/>CCRYP_000826-RA protein AED:0.09 eAED:0.09 QI:0/-1/0/1/-1/1/1/0/490